MRATSRDTDNSHLDNNPLSNQRSNISSPVPSTSALSRPPSNGPSNLVNINGTIQGPPTSAAAAQLAASSALSMASGVVSFSGFHAISPAQNEFSLGDITLDMFPSSSWDLGGNSTSVVDNNLQPNHSMSMNVNNNNFLTNSSVASSQTSTSVSTSISNSARNLNSQGSNQSAYMTQKQHQQAQIQQQTQSSRQLSQSHLSHHQQQPQTSGSAFGSDAIAARGVSGPSPCQSPATQLSSTSSPGSAQAGYAFPYSPVSNQNVNPASGKSSPAALKTSSQQGTISNVHRKSEDGNSESYGSDSRSRSPAVLGNNPPNLMPDSHQQKLRNLLTQGIEEADSSVPKTPSSEGVDCPSSSASESEITVGRGGHNQGASGRNENTILRELLNQDDEESDYMGAGNGNLKSGQRHGGGDSKNCNSGGMGMMGGAENVKTENGLENQRKNMANNNNNNNMLRKVRFLV